MADRARRWQQRHSVIALCALATLICYLDRVNMSVAAIALQEQFGWDDTIKGVVLSAFFAGYLVMQVPSGILANVLGGKLVLGAAVLWWSTFTILTPAAAGISLVVLVITRVALGLGEAAAFPAIFSLYRDWVPARERSRSVAVTLAAAHIGTVIALLASGWIIGRFGWPAVFYAFGIAGWVWVLFWYRLAATQPTVHHSIPAGEMAPLLRSAPPRRRAGDVPWRALLSSPAVRALMASHFCANWVMYVLLAWMPSYFRAAHGLSITDAARYSAAPYFVAFGAAVAGGWFADRWLERGGSATVIRKTMQATGLLGAAAFLLFVRQVEAPPQALAAMCGALGLLSLTLAGTGTATLEVAPMYADVLSGLSNTVATIPGVVAVIVTGWLIDTTGSYDAGLVLTAIVGITGAVVWVVWGSARDVLAERVG